jgi:hypothetical protein
MHHHGHGQVLETFIKLLAKCVTCTNNRLTLFFYKR